MLLKMLLAARGIEASFGIDGCDLSGDLPGANPIGGESILPFPSLPAKIDKSVLAVNEPKRIRSKEHLPP
jgi:hypothetical protein